jgi:hypothetical protein
MKKLAAVGLAAAVVTGIYLVSARVAAQDADAGAKQPDATAKEAARKLLKTMRSEEMAKMMMDQMFTQFKQAMPQVPAEFWVKFKARIDFAEFVEMVVPIYARHLKTDDIKGMTQFFESPLGQRFLDAQPKIQLEQMKAGQAWGQKIGQQVMAELMKQQGQQ